MSKKANKPYSSKLIDSLLSEITDEEQKRTNRRMMLAARIEDAMKAKGWSQRQLSEKLGKNPSEISKWLSGTHNFTTDTLFDLEDILDVLLVNTVEVQTTKVVHVIRIQVSDESLTCFSDESLTSRALGRSFWPSPISFKPSRVYSDVRHVASELKQVTYKQLFLHG